MDIKSFKSLKLLEYTSRTSSDQSMEHKDAALNFRSDITAQHDLVEIKYEQE
jgi:hypothetical protein